ncbi:MAG: hypothetical protein H6R18_1254 [Proteobacteria bacterium]|nr:hypothetical protein [Pseudomonadota bacterium]
MLNKLQTLILGLVAMAFSLFGFSAHAAGPDMSTLTAAVDFGTVTAAILAVAAALIVVYIAWKGAQMVLGAVRRG